MSERVVLLGGRNGTVSLFLESWWKLRTERDRRVMGHIDVYTTLAGSFI